MFANIFSLAENGSQKAVWGKVVHKVMGEIVSASVVCPKDPAR
jgi:hypothetical protein